MMNDELSESPILVASVWGRVGNEQIPCQLILNSMARQTSAERAWASIQRFDDNCKSKDEIAVVAI